MADATTVYRAHPTQAEIDGRFYLETASVTRKARNVAARPRTSLLIQGPASTGRSLMVAAEGSARIIAGAEAHAINHRLRAKYIRPGALDAIDRAWDRFDDVAIEITPRRWRSWTGDLLHAETQKELDGSYDDAWLPD